jgi:putative NADH-flavin reductase
MKIAVIGATGMAGSRIAAKAVQRGHTVSGFSRSPGIGARVPAGVSALTTDASNPDAMRGVAAHHDVIVLATRPTPGSEDGVGSVATTVLDAAFQHGRRVLVIGGAATLRTPDCAGRLVIDDPRFVPPEWRAVAQANLNQFHACMAHPANLPALFEPCARNPHATGIRP